MDFVNKVNICRLCLFKSDSLIYIFEVNVRHGFIAAEVITDLLQYKVCERDGYPQFVCHQCLNQLNEFRIFKKRCNDSKIAFDNSPKQCISEDQYYPDQEKFEPIQTMCEGVSFSTDVPQQENIAPIWIKQEVESFEAEEQPQDVADNYAIEKNDFSTRIESDEECIEKTKETDSEVCELGDIPSSGISLETETHVHTGNSGTSDKQVSIENKRKTPDSSSKVAFTNPKQCIEAASCECSHCIDSRHIQDHGIDRCTVDDEDAVCKKRRNANTAYDEKKPFSCHICSKSFPRSGTLEIHMRVHSGEKPYSCEECGRRFTQKGALTMHALIHTGEKAFSCTECGKSFARKVSLIIHARTHSGERPYACSTCDKRFGDAGSLAHHARVHSGERPFTCPRCSMRFSSRGNLVKHASVHSSEKPFKCEECSMGFKQKGSLIKHLKIHKGIKEFKCSECDKSFTEKYQLERHISSHGDEEAFRCRECSKTFTRNDNLVKHLKIHSGNKPFFCTKCDKSFAIKYHLVRHLRAHDEKEAKRLELSSQNNNNEMDSGKTTDEIM